jgi:AcrR family transcriptional regulator
MQEEKKAANAQKAEDIKQAAFSLMVERGLCEMTTAMVADKARASKGLIHYYFESKESLIIEVMRWILENYLGFVKDLLEHYPDNEDKLEKGLSESWNSFKADPSLMIAIFETKINGRNSQELSRTVIQFHREIVEELKKFVLAGWGATDKASEKEAEAIVTIVLGVFESLALRYILDPEATDFEYTFDVLNRAIETIMRDRQNSP